MKSIYVKLKLKKLTMVQVARATTIVATKPVLFANQESARKN